MYLTKTIRFECSVVSIIIFCYIIHYLMQPIVDTIETIENVDRKPSVEYDKIYIVCVHGNIGAGKSTYIAKQKDFV